MLIDNKEKVIKLTVDGYFRGTVTSFKGNDDEYYIIRDMITEFEAELRTWLQENEKDLISEQQKQFTDKLFYKILYWRMQGWILGEIVDHDLEYEIKKIT